MLIKVCGMRSSQQVRKIEESVNYVGFIFYKKSSRFVRITPEVTHAQKVGVFVDSPLEEVKECIEIHSLDAVQLHGQETPEYCSDLQTSAQVIKAFGVDSNFSFDTTKQYANTVYLFLFDTKTPLHGGSGKRFDWSVLSNYKGRTPFLLSGGLSPDSLEDLKQFDHPKFAGIDLNSGFEHAPKDKNIPALTHFIEQLKQ